MSQQGSEESRQQNDSKLLQWLAVIAIGILALLYYLYSVEGQLQLIKKSFKGNKEFSHPPCFVNHTTMIEQMKDTLKSHTQHTTGMYYLLEGPHGSGKTTALKAAAETIDDNIAYVMVDIHEDFGVSLADALFIDLGCKESQSPIDKFLGIIFLKKKCPETTEARVQSCFSLLETALKQIKKEGNPAPVLIIDHVDILLGNNISIAFTLQAFAKRMADEHLLTIYFVSSEVKMYNLLLQKSAASRMETFPHYTWDLPYDKALKYMDCLYKFVYNNITEIIGIVGGRFSHILSANAVLQQLRENNADVNIMDVKNKLFETVVLGLQALNISLAPPTDKPSHDLSDVTWSLANKIVTTTSKTISFKEANEMLEKLSQNEKDELKEASIFYFDWIKQEVVFQSTLVHSYFKDAFENVQTLRDTEDK